MANSAVVRYPSAIKLLFIAGCLTRMRLFFCYLCFVFANIFSNHKCVTEFIVLEQGTSPMHQDFPSGASRENSAKNMESLKTVASKASLLELRIATFG